MVQYRIDSNNCALTEMAQKIKNDEETGIVWLPAGWWIIVEKSPKGARFTAGASGLDEISSQFFYPTERQATSAAKNALRQAAYTARDSGWTENRVHLCVAGQSIAFCGAMIRHNPNTKHAYSEQCGNCMRIAEKMEA